MEQDVELSIVGTLYQSGHFLDEFYSRIRGAAASVTERYEIVLVNDGSPDRSLEMAIDLQRRDPRVVVVDLARNFGHHRAIMVGLAHARGHRVFLIDTDLEESPEWLVEFHEMMEKTSADVVYGVSRERNGNWINRLAGHLSWRILDRVSPISIPADQTTVRLMSRRYVEALLEVKDNALYLGAAFFWPGFLQVGYTVQKVSRRQRSTYGLLRRVRGLYNAIVSFSSAPLIGVFVVGVVISGMSFLWAFLLGIRKLLDPAAVLGGYTSLMASLWMLGGLVILGIGIVCLYIAKIYEEVKSRPRAVVRDVYRRTSGD